MMERAEILVGGRVQGVGFRYFVLREAEQRGLLGRTRNLPTGEVFTIAEGNRSALVDLYAKLQNGPLQAVVERHSIQWSTAIGEFQRFEIVP
jgi:acylphosphatase